MSSNLSARFNADLLEDKYAAWKEDPQSVEATWAAFFEGFELGIAQTEETDTEGGSGGIAADRPTTPGLGSKVVSMTYAFRSIGHTAAWLDPLSVEPPEQPRLRLDELGFSDDQLDLKVATPFYEGGREMRLREMLDRLRRTYCGHLGFEFMHIHEIEVRNWLRDRIEGRMEAPAPTSDCVRELLTWLTHAEAFERFLHRKYVGQKRFSLEGGESLMVALNTLLERSPGRKVQEIVMGMAHRGRLNVLANLLHKPLDVLLYEFSDNYVPDLVAGDGDVKYHLGYESSRTTSDGEDVSVFLAANPSHLEAVNAVVEGKARARQRFLASSEDETVNRRRVLPVLIHGDAAFAGQGSVAEVLNFSQLPGYRTGGTIHLVVNNQIGFTTMPEDARSSSYCTDVAKMIEAPVIHVNGDDPLDVMFATELAFEFRQQFSRDVVIDIVCYRRHGHNEGDEPAFTQPKTYREIRNHSSVAELFREWVVKEGLLSKDDVRQIEDDYNSRLERELEQLKQREDGKVRRPDNGDRAEAQPEYSHDPVVTGITVKRFKEIGDRLTRTPDDFKLNSKIEKRFLEPRRQVLKQGEGFNWAFAESLSFGSLLTEGIAVRLSGQDCRRGTFSQRHAVFYDGETRERYIPLLNLSEDQARFCVYNSLLSEAGVLGFDYGYSLMVKEMLILWEAQFGDFSNGAQVIIDQFIASAESKWGRSSHLTLLLPHGYEGQGPEHSSARLERFLQLCADSNLQVCNLTTPAQYFHVLRRQMMRPFRKPLVLMTPKSMLNHPGAVSKQSDFTGKSCFMEILDDPEMGAKKARDRVNRLILCSGKVYYDLLEYRAKNEIRNAALIRVEQLYPFHSRLFEEIFARYPKAGKLVWCQEEPQNMGAWTYIEPCLDRFVRSKVRYAGRDEAASPAAGAKAVHVREQRRLIEEAFNE